MTYIIVVSSIIRHGHVLVDSVDLVVSVATTVVRDATLTVPTVAVVVVHQNLGVPDELSLPLLLCLVDVGWPNSLDVFNALATSNRYLGSLLGQVLGALVERWLVHHLNLVLLDHLHLTLHHGLVV